jgi:hypothetical protein
MGGSCNSVGLIQKEQEKEKEKEKEKSNNISFARVHDEKNSVQNFKQNQNSVQKLKQNVLHGYF